MLKVQNCLITLIAGSIGFAEVANAQMTGSYGSAGGQYSIPGATYQQRIYTPRDSGQTPDRASYDSGLGAQTKKNCADKLRSKYGSISLSTTSSKKFSQYLDELIQCRRYSK